MFYLVSKVAWFLATPSNLLPLLILVGLALIRWGHAKRFGLGLAAASVLLLLAAGLSPLANWVILPLEQRFPAYQDDGRPVAGVIVLGGALHSEESAARGQLLFNEAGERLTALADLARRYPSARLVFSGGAGDLFGPVMPEAEGLRQFAPALGLAPERILFENQSRTTAENAVFTRRLVEPQPGERWLLVTSAWHMPRSIGCFRQAGFPVTAYPVDFRTRGAQDAGRPFQFTSEGLRRLDAATKEWAGLIAYRLAGYTDALLPSASE